MKLLSKFSSVFFLLISLAIVTPNFLAAVDVTVPTGGTTTGSRNKTLLANPSGGIQVNGLIGSLLTYNITWSITDLGNNAYKYTYNLGNLLGLSATQNDFFIETGDNVSAANLKNASIKSGVTDLLLNNGATIYDTTLNGVHGIVFHNTGLLGTSLLVNEISFVVNAAPVWGSFRSGSLLDLAGQAQNVGFTSDPTASTSNYTNWVASVGTLATPEPTTLLTLASALVAAYFVTSRRQVRKTT